MKPIIHYRFCGGRWSHAAHWLRTGESGWAGAADYYCVGYHPAEINVNKEN